MHYYQFNIGDYASHTARLSPIEDLAYRRLLDGYYLNERPFNGCSTDVAREIGLREYQAEVDYVLKKFFENVDGDWVQERAEREIKAYQSKLESASKAGKASAKARRRKASERSLSDGSTKPNERSTGVQPNKKQEPINNNQDNNVPVKPKRSTAEAVDYSVFGLADEYIKEIKRIRKKNKGGAITQRVANILAKEFRQAMNSGWRIDNILDEWELRGWKAFKAEWMKGFGQGQAPQQTTLDHESTDWIEGMDSLY